MLKPLRFNELLKAVPGLAHLQHTPNSKTHTLVSKAVDVNKVNVSETTGEVTQRHAHATVTTDIEEHDVHHAHGADIEVIKTRVKADVDVTSVTKDVNTGATTILSHVHATTVGVTAIEMTPPHPPREETPIYASTHHHMVFTQDMPCAICGVCNSTLNDPKHNLFGAKDLETHHYPIERCLLDACDPRKVAALFPQVKDHQSLEAFIDSEANMMVLCDIHHRHPLYGIHHLVGPDFYVQPFLYGGYQIAATPESLAQVTALDEKIVKRHLSIEEITHEEGSLKTTVTKQTKTTVTHTNQEK